MAPILPPALTLDPVGSQLLYRRSEHLFNEAPQSANPRGGAYPREVSNSKFSTPSKIYIARLLGLDVFDPFGDRLGRLRDVVVLKRGLGASIAGARPAKGTEPIVVGIIVEVLGKKRVFMPMTRVRSIDASQIISTGLVNLRRFEQRNSETLIVGELFDRRVRLLDGSGDAVIEDVAIEQRRNGDWA